jgi:hypothetical protein
VVRSTSVHPSLRLQTGAGRRAGSPRSVDRLHRRRKCSHSRTLEPCRTTEDRRRRMREALRSQSGTALAEHRLSTDGTAKYRPQLVRRGMDARGLCRLSAARRPHRIRAGDSQALWAHSLGRHRDGNRVECIHGRSGAIRRTNRRGGPGWRVGSSSPTLVVMSGPRGSVVLAKHHPFSEVISDLRRRYGRI